MTTPLEPGTKSPVRQLLASTGFRRFLGATLATSVALGTTRFAFIWAMGDLSDWEPALGLLGIGLGLPALVVSAPAGSLADRHDRRRVAGLAAATTALACAACAALLAADALDARGLGFMALVVSTPLAALPPATQAMVPALVPPERLLNGVALQNMAMMGSLILGAFLGGGLIGLGNAAGLDGNATAFAGMALVGLLGAVLLLRLPDEVGHVASAGRAPLRAGLEHARAHPVVGTLLAMGLVIGMATAAAMLLLPELARDELGVGAFPAGLLNAAMSVGLVATASYLASRSSIPRPARWAALGFGGTAGPVLVLIGLSPVYLAALAAVLVWGLGGGIVMTIQRTLLQRHTPDALMGRIMGLSTLAQFGTFPLGALVIFAVSGALGTRGTIVAFGIGVGICAVPLALRLDRSASD